MARLITRNGLCSAISRVWFPVTQSARVLPAMMISSTPVSTSKGFCSTTPPSSSAHSLSKLIRMRAESNTPALVVCHQRVDLTYQQLAGKVLSFASALADLGYGPGQKLLMVLENSAENVVTQLAAGVVGCNIVTVKTAADLPQVVQEHECKGVVIPAADMGSAKEARDKCTHDPIVVGGSFFDAADCLHFEVLAQSYPPYADNDNGHGTSYFYNSSKGVSVDSLVAKGAETAEVLRLARADRVCVPVTLNHPMGFGFGVLAAIHSGCALVLPAASPDAAATLTALKEHKCSILYADSHTLKALPSDANAKEEGMEALRGGLTKIGSGESFGLGKARTFAGVDLITVGKE